MKFLKELCEEDQERIDLIQEMMGYCLTTSTKAEKIFFLKGSGGEGKSVLLSCIRAIVGKNNVSSVPLERLNKNFAAVEMVGKLINIADENEPTEEMKTSLMKRISSGNETQFEQKNEKAFTYKPFTKLLFSFNKLPLTKDTTTAFRERLIIIPFYKKHRNTNDEDPSLREKLLKKRAGIFAFAMKGLRLLQQKRTQIYKGQKIELRPYKFTLSECAEKEHQRYFGMVDYHEAFLNDCVRIILGEEDSWKKHKIFGNDMYTAFKAWAGPHEKEAKKEDRETFHEKMLALLKEKGAYDNREPKQCYNNSEQYYPNVEFTQDGARKIASGKAVYGLR
jgi:P4 family phage/plasmid primase-like protien